MFPDADISGVALAFGCEFAPEHVAFLQTPTSCTLHANPGSGKTTLLVAKLALLARTWKAPDQGILVLSHTNVAREEVERRLAIDGQSSRLLSYPHYVGTIHGFVNRFIALPYLRDIGLDGRPAEDPQVDDERFAALAERRFFESTQYAKARKYYERKYGQGRETIRTLSYEGANDVSAVTGKIPKATSTTGAQLRMLKAAVSKLGVFRNADMFAIAAMALRRHRFLHAALRRRFPWVFVDEAQDNSKEQEEIISEVFLNDNCILQTLGDENQAIYSESDPGEGRALRPSIVSLALPKSQRMSPKLAELVSPLSVVRPTTIHGNTARRDRGHCILTFDDSSISWVLGEFGDRVLEGWEGRPPSSIRPVAVGFRRNRPEKAHVPGCISDYWSAFRDPVSPERSGATTMIGSVRYAQRLARSRGELWGPCRELEAALARAVWIGEGKRCTRRDLTERCQSGAIDERAFRAEIREMLGDCAQTPERWRLRTLAIRNLLSVQSGPPLDSYLEWQEDSRFGEGANQGKIYRHISALGQLDIELGTIHSVKGQTHDATLVLETHAYEYDVPLGLSALAGELVPQKHGRTFEHLKRLFVACTRPRELLCIAVNREHVSQELLDRLRSRGWMIRNVDTRLLP